MKLTTFQPETKNAMPSSNYRSSTLTCHPEADCCLVCDFIGGERSTAAMLEVIRILDAKLDQKERLLDLCLEVLAAMVGDSAGEHNVQ